ncbi:MAG: hypothetical protein QXT53_08580, partial [Ignisphaera sp.]
FVEGFVRGYISLTGYSMTNTINGNGIYMPNIDAVKTVSLATAVYTFALLAMSTASTALVYKRRYVTASALAYGVSLSLEIVSGVLRYLTQAFSADASTILAIARNGNTIRLATSAGIIEYPGIETLKTVAYRIVFETPYTLLIPLTVAVALSLAAIVWTIYLYGKYVEPATAVEKRVWTKIKSVKKLLTTQTPIAVALILILAVASAGTFVYSPMQLSTATVTPPIKFQQPPATYCIALTRIGRGAIYYTDFEALPSNWAIINGSLGARGFIGPGGYWGLVNYGYKGRGLRGFPLLWQVREQKTYSNPNWNPDVRFIPQATNAIRIDSYTAGSLGNGYLMTIMPIELINETVIRNRFNVYYTFSNRIVGFIDIVNKPIDRRNDTYFATYNDWVPPWQKYIEIYYRLYTVYMPSSGTRSFDITNTTVLQGYGPYVTFSYVLTDYWIRQSLYFDVFYVLLKTTDNQIISNFTFPYNTYTVIMERSGTYNDYGYLKFGFPGFTALYLNEDLSSYNSLWLSTKINNRNGIGWGSILLIDSSKSRFYAIAVNTSGYLTALRNSGASWVTISSSQVRGYVNNAWYALYINYTRSGGVNYVTAYLYDASGNLVSQLRFSDSTFQPIYVGLGSYASNLLYVDIIYDDFIVSTSDPRTIAIQNVPVDYSVELWDNLGNLVGSVTSASGTVTFNVVTDAVVGTGVDGKIVVRFPDGMPCLVYTSGDAILGGDTYSLLTGTLSWSPGANYTSLAVSAKISSSSASITGFIVSSIYNSDSKPYYARLLLSSYTGSAYLTANITIRNSTYTSQPIRIVGGASATTSTDWVKIGSDARGNISFSGYFTTAGQSGTVYMLLQYCTQPGGGVCVYYPVRIDVSS